MPLLIALMVPLFAGCVDDAPTVESGLRLGDWAEYEGSDGSRLRVEVAGTTTRADGFLQDHEVLVYEFSLWSAERPDFALQWNESMDLADGLVVRQDLRCAFGARLPEEGDPCAPDLKRVFFGPHGLPGGLGAGPFLVAGALPEDGAQTPLRSGIVPGGHLTYAITPLDGDCVGIQATTDVGVDDLPAFMPGTVLDGPFVMCEGEPFPTRMVLHMAMPEAFSQERFPEYRRISWDRGDEPVTFGSASSWEHPELDRRAPGPLGLLDRCAPPSGFDSHTAHDEAKNLDLEYARLIDAGGIVTKAQHFTGGSMKSGVLPLMQRFDSWGLEVRSESGEARDLEVQRTQQWVNGELQDTSYAITTTRSYETDAPPASLSQQSYVRACPWLGFMAEDLGGEDVAPSTSLSHRDHLYGPLVENDLPKVTILAIPGDTPKNQSLVVPWRVSVDLASGQLRFMDLHPERHANV